MQGGHCPPPLHRRNDMTFMTRRLRLGLIIAAGVILALLLALFIAARVLLQPERFSDMLRDAAATAGLKLTLGAPAEPSLWPQPAVVLRDMTLSVKGRPLLLVAKARLVVPWRAFLGGPPSITQLQLQSPRLDIGAVPSALAQLPPSAGGVPNLPRIDTGIVVEDGSLVLDDRVLLDHMHLETGVLAPGQPFALHVIAQTATAQRYAFDLSMTPHTGNGALQFDDMRFEVNGPADTQGALQGRARWSGGANLQLDLAGTAQRHVGDVYQLALQLHPATTGTPMLLAIKMTGKAAQADLRLPPSQLAAWWDQAFNAKGNRLPLPPLDGHAEVSAMDVGGVHVEGLELRAGDALPAVASSAPAVPAGAVATPR